MTLFIRPAVASDEDILASLLAAQFVEHDISLDRDVLRAAIRTPLHDAACGAFLVASEGTHTLGFAYLAVCWTLEHGGRSAWLDELYVVPDRRSAGIGTALLRAAIDYAKEAKYAAIDLEVEADHARAARLYAREGFRAHTRTRWVLALR